MSFGTMLKGITLYYAEKYKSHILLGGNGLAMYWKVLTLQYYHHEMAFKCLYKNFLSAVMVQSGYLKLHCLQKPMLKVTRKPNSFSTQV